MAKFPALPLWTDAYLADCGHLTDAEHGRYLMLMMILWRAPKQRIPNDDQWLARMFRRSVDDVQSEIRPIVSEFCDCDGNWITQRRISREFRFVDQQSKKQSERAKSRWSKEKGSCRGTTTSGIAPTPTPTPTPKKEKRESESQTQNQPESQTQNPRGSSPKGARLSADWVLPRAWGEWAVSEGMEASVVRKEAATFRDYWIAKSGKDAVKLDWEATWRNWIRRAHVQVQPQGGARRETGDLDLDAVARRIEARRQRVAQA